MKRLTFLTIGLLSILLLGSCSKDEEATGIGDAIIISKKTESETIYGLAFYAYTFSSFKTVEATCNNAPAKIYKLESNQGYSTNFYYEMPESEYTTTRPVATTVNFAAVFENGVVQSFQDELSGNILSPLTVNKCKFNTTENHLETTWALSSSASSYSVNILDGTTVVFRGTELANTVGSLNISSSTSGWKTDYTPVTGKTYTIRFSAYLYESSANNAYNLQSISFTDKTVKWGE